jgi:hypothetical protein
MKQAGHRNGSAIAIRPGLRDLDGATRKRKTQALILPEGEGGALVGVAGRAREEARVPQRGRGDGRRRRHGGGKRTGSNPPPFAGGDAMKVRGDTLSMILAVST